MPAWDFKCARCGAVRTESFRSVEEADSRAVWCRAAACQPAIPGGVCRMERQPAAPNFVLKGAGWTPKHY